MRACTVNVQQRSLDDIDIGTFRQSSSGSLIVYLTMIIAAGSRSSTPASDLDRTFLLSGRSANTMGERLHNVTEIPLCEFGVDSDA